MPCHPGSVRTTSGTRAAGVRASYDQLPSAVRGWIDRQLGSSVVSATTQSGGFSPGAAARLVTSAGRRAFVKAVGSTLNPDSPDIFRRERTAMEAMPVLPWTPRLLAAYDDGDWVALLLEDIEGREPAHPWNAADTDRVFSALTDLAAALTPTPWPDARLLEEGGLFRGGWQRLQESTPPDLDPWAVDHLEEFVALQRHAVSTVAGETLVHWDIRADNILLTDDRVVFVDWAWAARGAAWTDVAVAALDLVISGSEVDADELLARHPLTSGVPADDVTALIVTVGGALTERAGAPPPPGLPTIRAYQRIVSAALLGWIRRRLG
jgi:aminoglycoside phosphotransferase